MGWKGFIGGAMQSAGKSGLEYFEAEHKSQLEADRAQRVIEMKQKYDEKARTDKVGRIETAKQGIIEESIGTKYAGSDSAVADAEARRTDSVLTDEQKATIKLAKDTDRETLSNDPDTYLKAGMKSGDLDIEKVVAIVKQDRANAIAMRKQLNDERKTDNQTNYQNNMMLLKERGLDIQDRKTNALLSKVASGGSGSVSAFVQSFDKVRAETGWDSDRILQYLNQGKTPVDTYSQTEEGDGFGGVKTKTIRKGAGSPASNASPAQAGPKKQTIDLDNLFPPRR